MYKKFMEKKRKNGGSWRNDYPCPDDGGMHDPNLNAVCFKCRFVTRFHMRRDDVPICPHCRQKMVNVWCTIRVPRKTNERGWKLFKKQCRILD